MPPAASPAQEEAYGEAGAKKSDSDSAEAEATQ